MLISSKLLGEGEDEPRVLFALGGCRQRLGRAGEREASPPQPRAAARAEQGWARALCIAMLQLPLSGRRLIFRDLLVHPSL